MGVTRQQVERPERPRGLLVVLGHEAAECLLRDAAHKTHKYRGSKLSEPCCGSFVQAEKKSPCDRDESIYTNAEFGDHIKGLPNYDRDKINLLCWQPKAVG